MLKKFLITFLIFLLSIKVSFSFGTFVKEDFLNGSGIKKVEIFIIKTESFDYVIKLEPLNLKDRIFLITPNNFVLKNEEKIKIGKYEYFGKWVEIFVNITDLKNETLNLKIISYPLNEKEIKVLQEKTIQIKINFESEKTNESKKEIGETLSEESKKEINIEFNIDLIIIFVLLFILAIILIKKFRS